MNSDTLAKMKPDQVVAYLRKQIRSSFGDEIENTSQVWASHGFYNLTIDRPKNYTISYLNVRKIQLPKIVKALRALGA